MLIRTVNTNDVVSLHELEQATWSKQPGTEILSEATLAEWADRFPEYFWVAEEGGVLLGYYFAAPVDFDLRDHRPFLDRLLQGDSYESGIVNTKVALQTISVVATKPAVSLALKRQLYQVLFNEKFEYHVGFSRMPLFSAFCRNLRGCNPVDAAWWYAYHSGRLLGGMHFPSVREMSGLCLPDVRRPDPVMKYYMSGVIGGVVDVVHGYMPDEKSLDYSAVLCSVFPHVPNGNLSLLS